MSKEPPAGAWLARTLEPREREQVEALRSKLIRTLAILVSAFLVAALVVVLDAARRENLTWEMKVKGSVIVLAMAGVVWVARWRISRLAKDLEQGAVYRLEGMLESKRRRAKKGRVLYELKVAGEKFDAGENQFEAITPGAACSIEFLPLTRLALNVDGIKRWP